MSVPSRRKRPRVGPVEATDDVHEGGFAGTARPHDGDKFAGLDFHRDAAHRPHLDFAGLIDLLYRLQFDDRLGVHG